MRTCISTMHHAWYGWQDQPDCDLCKGTNVIADLCVVCGEELVEGRDTIHGEIEGGVLVNLAHLDCTRKVS